MPYPGFDATVSPARGREATHSASQRLVIDFSTDPPRAAAVVPGGQSGDPLHPRFYDNQLDAFVNFEYYPIRLPASPSDLPDSVVTGRSTLTPPAP
jgi:penicillin amidase